MIRRLLTLAAVLALMMPLARADDGTAAFEQKIADATKSDKITVIHFWAPWCPNCRHELSNSGWSDFIVANPNVNFIFITAWNPVDGHEVLAKNGVGAEPNFQLYLHPNHSRKRGEMMSAVMGLPVSWIPTTWIFKNGKLTYAMNYGELRFPVLRQLIADSNDSW